jgi:4-diphosphocytidyl-2-C-methyl-D-erythritol kinase
VIVFPNCKINLGLNVLQKRSDGFHDLETIFYPLALQDALEIIAAPLSEQDAQLAVSGLSLDTVAQNNSCLKAYHLLKKDYPELPPVQMHLHKVIPAGAGLGGGSADGAFTLLLLNKIGNLGIPEDALLGYALTLGSDCPFFILNKPAWASGRGELLEPLHLDFSRYRFILVNPGIHVDTAGAFSRITPNKTGPSLRELISRPIEEWKTRLINDFEKPLIDQYPAIGDIREKLYQRGALYASMSGSGSTVFGIFPKAATPQLDFPLHYFVKTL